MAIVGLIRDDTEALTSSSHIEGKIVAIDRHANWLKNEMAGDGPEGCAGTAGMRSIQSLYPAPESGSRHFVRAMDLLSRTIGHLHQAIAAVRQNEDEIGADLEIQRLHSYLQELFDCRKLGDGFAALINAASCAVENLRGAPMNVAQMEALLSYMRFIQSEPYVDFDLATERLDLLEQVGFSIMPNGYNQLADWLDGDSTR